MMMVMVIVMVVVMMMMVMRFRKTLKDNVSFHGFVAPHLALKCSGHRSGSSSVVQE